MADPARLLESAPDELTARLLGSAKHDAPPTRALERTAVALGVGGAAFVTSGTATAKLAGLAVLKWIGVGATVGLVTAGGSLAVSHLSQARASIAAPSTAAVKTTAVHRTQLPAPIATIPAAREPAPRRIPTSKPAAPSIADEIQALDRAKSSLDQRDPAAALATLDRLERAGARALAPEALVIRAEALLARGKTDEAAALARRFVAENPNSPHVARMKVIDRSAVRHGSE